jgi:hypothetical protein
MGLVMDISCLPSRRDFAALCYDSRFSVICRQRKKHFNANDSSERKNELGQ